MIGQITHMKLYIVLPQQLMSEIARKQQLSQLIQNFNNLASRRQKSFPNPMRYLVSTVAGNDISHQFR